MKKIVYSLFHLSSVVAADQVVPEPDDKVLEALSRTIQSIESNHAVSLLEETQAEFHKKIQKHVTLEYQGRSLLSHKTEFQHIKNMMAQDKTNLEKAAKELRKAFWCFFQETLTPEKIALLFLEHYNENKSSPISPENAGKILTTETYGTGSFVEELRVGLRALESKNIQLTPDPAVDIQTRIPEISDHPIQQPDTSAMKIFIKETLEERTLKSVLKNQPRACSGRQIYAKTKDIVENDQVLFELITKIAKDSGLSQHTKEVADKLSQYLEKTMNLVALELYTPSLSDIVSAPVGMLQTASKRDRDSIKEMNLEGPRYVFKEKAKKTKLRRKSYNSPTKLG